MLDNFSDCNNNVWLMLAHIKYCSSRDKVWVRQTDYLPYYADVNQQHIL